MMIWRLQFIAESSQVAIKIYNDILLIVQKKQVKYVIVSSFINLMTWY